MPFRGKTSTRLDNTQTSHGVIESTAIDVSVRWLNVFLGRRIFVIAHRRVVPKDILDHAHFLLVSGGVTLFTGMLSLLSMMVINKMFFIVYSPEQSFVVTEVYNHTDSLVFVLCRSILKKE